MHTQQRWNRFGAPILMFAAGCTCLVSQADAQTRPPVMFHIEATSENGCATWEYVAEELNLDGSAREFRMDKPIPLRDKDTGMLIAVLEAAEIRVGADPILPAGLPSAMDTSPGTTATEEFVVLNFLVTTGGAAADFTVTSANNAFTTISSAVGRSAASVTVTDNDGNGAVLTGEFPGSRIYRAYFNDPGNMPAAGTPFASLVDTIASAGAYTSASATDEHAIGGNLVPIGAVSDMSSQFKFSVDAGSSASGTSVFVVAPGSTGPTDPGLVGAGADAGDAPVVDFEIKASSALGSGSWRHAVQKGAEGDGSSWVLGEPVPILDTVTGTPVAVLEATEFRVDPVTPADGFPVPMGAAPGEKIVLSFVVSTGGAQANFSITSANDSFATILSAVGRAAASATVTDFGSNGTLLSGDYSDGTMYRAFYNDSAGVSATGTPFAKLLADISSAPPYTSASATDELAVGGGFVPIGDVSDISAQWKFSVDALSSASGTSVLFVTACGNGLLDTDEECDAGDMNSDSTPDACRLDCTTAGCGDGVVDTGEECDKGALNSNSGACGVDCTCNVGYSSSGGTCTDDDECALGTHDCDVNASCTNTVGSFACACEAGYFGNGVNCSPCPAGTFAAAPGTTVCAACPAGTFSAAPGATVCTPCPGPLGNPCSGNGVCLADSGICVCTSGLAGTACDLIDTDADGIADEDDECPGGLDTTNITATVVLDAVFPGAGGVPQPLTRCIRFVATNGTTDACSDPIDVQMDFYAGLGGVATATVMLVDVDCDAGGLTHLCAKDEQHTLWDTVDLINMNSNNLAAADLLLLGGDTNNDGGVDVNDATYLVAHWSEADSDGNCPWNGDRGADFGNDGSIGVEDYTFLSAHWIYLSDCACAPGNPLDATASVAISPGGESEAADGSADLDAVGVTAGLMRVSALPAGLRRKVDLNRDGLFDHRDMRLFEIRHGLPQELSAKMRATAAASASASDSQPVEGRR